MTSALQFGRTLSIGISIVALLAIAPLSGASTTRAASFPSYAAIDLGRLATDTGNTIDYATNVPMYLAENGDMAGYRYLLGSETGSETNTELVIWHSGTVVTIPLPSTYSSAIPAGINSSDQIAAYAILAGTSNEVLVVVKWSPSSTNWTALPISEKRTPVMVGISNNGDVAGDSADSSYVGFAIYPILWTPSGSGYTERQLASSGYAVAIDDLGNVVGYTSATNFTTAKGPTTVTLWSLSGATTVGTASPNTFFYNCGSFEMQRPFAVGDSQESGTAAVVTIVGQIDNGYFCGSSGPTAPYDKEVATEWQVQVSNGLVSQQSGPVPMAPVSASCNTAGGANSHVDPCDAAEAVTSSGRVVGLQYSGFGNYAPGDAFLETGGQTQALESLLGSSDQSKWNLRPPFAASAAAVPFQIDSHGDILTAADAPDGSVHALLLTPATSSSGSTLFNDAFDSQPPGNLVTGSGTNVFTGTGGPPANLRVVSYYSNSASNCLGSNVVAGGSAYAYKTYAANATSHTLTFAVMFSPHFSLPAGSYVSFAGTQPNNSQSAIGTVELNVNSNGQLFIAYWNSSGQQRYVYGNGQLSLGSWNTISLQQNAAGPGAGTLTLLVDGKMAAQANSIDLGATGAGSFAIGNLYSPSGFSTSGQIYVDNLVTTVPSAMAAAHLKGAGSHRTSRFHVLVLNLH
jgi:Concanavalin A-like lectin/glucanases superfamily